MNWNDGSTSCDKWRGAIADAVIARSDPDSDMELARHLAGCDACRAYRADCETMWARLGELHVPAPAADARARFAAAVRAETGGSRRARPLRYAVLAASVVVAALLGYGAASRRAASPVVQTTQDSTPKFLLLLYDSGKPDQEITPARMNSIIAEYSAWARGLASAGHLVSAEKLSDTPSEWYGGSVTTTTGERVGGFFLIRARDLDEARRITESCPHLKHGGRVELRPIHPT